MSQLISFVKLQQYIYIYIICGLNPTWISIFRKQNLNKCKMLPLGGGKRYHMFQAFGLTSSTVVLFLCFSHAETVPEVWCESPNLWRAWVRTDAAVPRARARHAKPQACLEDRRHKEILIHFEAKLFRKEESVGKRTEKGKTTVEVAGGGKKHWEYKFESRRINSWNWKAFSLFSKNHIISTR